MDEPTMNSFPAVVTPQVCNSPEVEANMSEYFDLARLFDEESFDMSNRVSDALSPRPIGPSAVRASHSSQFSTPLLGAFQHLQQQTGASVSESTQQPQQDPNSQLMNLLFIVDPNTQQLVFPRGPVTAGNNSGTSFSTLSANIFGSGSASGQVSGHNFTMPPSETSPMFNLESTKTVSPLGRMTVPPLFPQSSPAPVSSLVNPYEQPEKGEWPMSAISALQQSFPLQQKLNAGQNQPLPPLRALSAYNFFFRDERDRVLHEKDYDWSQSKQEKLLREHWARDRTKKRRHRKTHGKIDFTTLSKLISTRWKALADHHKEFYRQIAARDWKRYQEELSEYKAANKTGTTITTTSSAPPKSVLSSFLQVTG